MPLYDYQCLSCDHIFELKRGMFEEDPRCPECDNSVRKIISAPASILDWRMTEAVVNSQRFRSAVRNRRLGGQ